MLLAVIVSLVMIAGFGLFLLVMNKNSGKIKEEQLAMDNKELGIVALQGESQYKKFNTQTRYTDLYIEGDNANVLLFDTADPANAYNVSVSDAVHNQLVRMQDKKEYDFKKPLIAYNPYGTNSCSLYMYFETKSDCYLRYTITVENEEIPDFVRVMNDSDGSGYSRHEYMITGFLPGITNYLSMELISEKGNYIDSCVYRIEMPASVCAGDVSIKADMAKDTSKISNGLFFCYGSGKKCIPAYDNSGYIRAEIPLLDNCNVPICVNNADMLVAYSQSGIARISRTGQVLDTYQLDAYKLGSQMLYNTRGQILAIASDNNSNTVNDLILCVDMESGKVKVAADMKDILKKVYKKSVKAGKSGSDWLNIESMEYINNNDLIINSEKTSSIIKLNNIMSENPTVGYIIGNKKRWNVKGCKDKLLKKTDVEDQNSESDSEGEENSGDTAKEDAEITNILEDGQTDIFEDMNNNVSMIYEPVAGDGEEEDNSAGRYYISVMNNNNGDTAYQRYMVNEDDGTYCLITEMELLQNNTGGSLQKMGDNYLVCQGEGKTFAEYGRDGSILISYSITADTVYKNSMKNFWFR